MQTEDYPTSVDDSFTYGGPNWKPTGIDPNKLGVRREDDPVAYLKAYRAAYAALKKAELSAKAAAKYAEVNAEKIRQREAKRHAKIASDLAKRQEAKSKRSAAAKAYKKVRNREKRKADQANRPEKYWERRAKKVKWASWDKFKWFYIEARRLTALTGQRWSTDHIYPIKSDWVCGLHTPDNLRNATLSENSKKASRPFGPCADELWEPNHYRNYWPGETLTLKQKERLATADARKEAREARAAELAQVRAKARAEKGAARRLLAKRPGRKPMTKEVAAARDDVKALLSGVSIREVVRQFGRSGVDVVRYARLVDPRYKSPFHGHGRPQKNRAFTTKP